ncbi:molybdopterin dinucleotide-binding protein [Candidatus Bathyarchaeota archaeon]|nr:molybdopterin dinucleotide-binding protein [Candidatus Bathyarchaeota archaeon]
MRRLRVYLLTGRTIEQGKAKEFGKTSNLYKDSVAVCYIDQSDMKTLGIKAKTPIKVSTEFGSVVVRAEKSSRSPHPGVVYIPYGPWANQVVDPETHGIGMPSFKGVPAVLEPVPGEKVKEIEELLRDSFGRGSKQ